MKVVDFVPAYLEVYNVEESSQLGTTVILRVFIDEIVVLKPGMGMKFPTGLILKTGIKESQLEIEKNNKGWEDEVEFWLEGFKEDKPLKVFVKNNSNKTLRVFPKQILTKLLVKEDNGIRQKR